MHSGHNHLSSLSSDKKFLLISMAGILLGTVRWLEFLALGIFAFDITGSAFLVALLALLRFLPLTLFGLFIGGLADQIDTNKLLQLSIALIGAVSGLMAILFILGITSYWLVAGATFLSGVFWASDTLLRRKLIGDIAGTERLGTAMGVDTAINNVTRLIGPLIGGFIYQWFGATGVFLAAVVLYMGSYILALSIPRSTKSRDTLDQWVMPPLFQAKQALKYALSNREVTLLLSITIVFNIWGFPMFSLVPVIGKVELFLSPSTIGIITALQGMAGFIGANAIAKFAKSSHYRPIFYYSVWVILLILPSSMTLALGVAGTGFAAAGYSIMQATLIYQAAPTPIRGRIFGLLTICIGSGVLGFANIGFMAETFGASNALWIVALEGALLMIIIGTVWSDLTKI